MVEATVSQIEAAQFLPRPAASASRRTDASAAPIWGCAWGTSNWSKPNSFASRERATLIGLTFLTTNGRPLVAPKLNRRRAVFVLSKIDEILAWEKATDQERDSRFVDLGRYLCEVRAGQYWRVDNLRSFDEFLERKFPESRRKAYYLMAIHEHLPRIPQGGTASRWDGPRPGNWPRWRGGSGRGSIVHPGCTKPANCPGRSSSGRLERHLTGKETEPWEILYFKAYKSQLPVIEQALETAGLMLGSDKSRGYCLEMICADFLAGVSLETGNQDALLSALTRLVLGLPKPQRKQLLEERAGGALTGIRAKATTLEA